MKNKIKNNFKKFIKYISTSEAKTIIIMVLFGFLMFIIFWFNLFIVMQKDILQKVKLLETENINLKETVKQLNYDNTKCSIMYDDLYDVYMYYEDFYYKHIENPYSGEMDGDYND